MRCGGPRLAGSRGAGWMAGRAGDVILLRDMLTAHRMTTVTGLPGAGKSAVTVAAASVAAGAFADGVWRVPLARLRDGALLAHAVTQSLPLADDSRLSQLDSLRAGLRGRQLLLVLDDCEHLARSCAEVAGALLEACPGLSIAATSREPLRLAGERLVTIRPLPLGQAVLLFSRRAREASAGFRLTPGNRATVAAICRRLDHLPLAVGLAARQLSRVSLDQLRDGLSQTWGGEKAVIPDRHSSLRAAIGLSHGLCTPAERLLWARLSVFSGQFGLADAVSVCAGPHLPPAAAADALLGLASRSLLVTAEAGSAVKDSAVKDSAVKDAAVKDAAVKDGGKRYWLPQTIRAYGAGMLRELGEDSHAYDRYRSWLFRGQPGRPA